jgi:hypothetical protein
MGINHYLLLTTEKNFAVTQSSSLEFSTAKLKKLFSYAILLVRILNVSTLSTAPKQEMQCELNFFLQSQIKFLSETDKVVYTACCAQYYPLIR